MEIKLEDISLKRFEELLNNLDVTEEGENLYLRCWQGGGSYILHDNGWQSQEFGSLDDLVKWLIEREEDIKSGNIIPISYE